MPSLSNASYGPANICLIFNLKLYWVLRKYLQRTKEYGVFTCSCVKTCKRSFVVVSSWMGLPLEERGLYPGFHGMLRIGSNQVHMQILSKTDWAVTIERFMTKENKENE